MVSSYTANTGIEKPATGDQSGTWGDTTNLNFDIVDRTLNGVGAITLSGTSHTLATTDGTLSDGMFKVLVLGGSPTGTNTITITPNDADKLYFVRNGSGESAVFSQGTGSNATVPNGATKIIYADGAGSGAAVSDLFDAVSITGGTITGITDLAVADGGTGASTASAARTNLGLAIGSDVQAFDSQLADVAGLAVTDGNFIVGNGTNFVAESGSTARASMGVAIGTDVQAFDADTLKADTADELTAGFSAAIHDAGTKSSGTYTPDVDDGNFQQAVNGGAHTLGVPSKNCTMVILYKNNASAGTVTTSGYTVVDGDTITTTNGHEFFFYITRVNDGSSTFSLLTVKALQ